MEKPKILVFDIEASNLQADFGFTHCISWMWHGEKEVHLLNRWDFSKPSAFCDKGLLQAFWPVAAEADLMVAHYGVKRSGFDFDLPFLNSRYLANGLVPFPETKYQDTHSLSKINLRLSSNSLGQIADFLGVKQQKSHLAHTKWTDVLKGDKKVMKQMGEYCKQDVRTLDAVFEKLKGFSKKIPNYNLFSTKQVCPGCGTQKTKSLGRITTDKMIYRRKICLSCGKTFKGEKIC